MTSIRLRDAGRAAISRLSSSLATSVSERPSGDRQQESFGQALTEDAAPAGADREPHRRLVVPGRGPRDEQAGDVHAADRQQQADRAEQRQQRRPDLTCRVVLQSHRVERGAVASVLHELAADRAPDRGDLLLAVLEPDAGFQPADDAEELLLAGTPQAVAAEQEPGLLVVGNRGIRGQQEPEPLGHDADDRGGAAVDENPAADQRRVAAITPLP